jgi:L-seryl-tRNA(Ser) seleniumtransferase
MKTSDLLHKLPSVAELLETPQLKRLVQRVNQSTVATGVRSVLDDLRVEYQRAKAHEQAPSIAELAERIARRVLLGDEPRMRPVINATGMLLDPLLCAPPLAEAALDALVVQGRDYASLRLDPLTGRRAERDEEAATLLVELTGAEAATVVNNLAGGLTLALAALAAGKEVIVARSQVIAISSGERLTDFLRAAGVLIHEVGAANKTQLSDYANAIGPQTAAILVVHPSHRQVVTNELVAEVSLSELSELAQCHHLPLVKLLDCATLLNSKKLGLPNSPAIEDFCSAGADLVIARGEGLVGGPESGLILGKRAVLQQLRGHRLAPAVQADKLALIALAATLRIYREPTQALLQIPILTMLSASLDNLRLRAEHIAPQLAALPGVASAVAVADIVRLGGGLDPFEVPLGTWCVQLKLNELEPSALERSLRMGYPMVLAHDQFEHLTLDLRGVLPRQDIELVAAVEAALN